MRKYILLLFALCLHGIARGQTCYYWFDSQQRAEWQQCSMLQGQFDVDVSAISEGVHTIHFQVVTEGGRTSPAVTALFIKPYSITDISNDAASYYAWFDDDFSNATKGDLSDGSILMDTESLKDGIHYVHLFVEGQALSSTVSAMYIKIPEQERMKVESLRCVSYIDGKQIDEKNIPVSGGVLEWNIDVSELKMGVHTHRVVVYNQDNIAMSERSSLFLHMPQKEQYLTSYDYWLNDEDEVKTVEIEGRPQNYSLLTMMPVEQRPIRSKCFHFELVEGVPTVYAKNNIHFRFHDASGDFTDMDKQFVDNHVSQSVNPALLESGVPSTIGKPNENEIIWYKVEAVRGDSLTFKADRACTIQLFSPSGEEIYSASSPEVLQFGGTYAPEDGTYYIALHDMTTNAENVTISYEHIDKYAVLSYTPDTIGAALSFVEIQLDGNGYDKLETAVLVMGENVIEPDSISVVSKSLSILRFPIWGTELLGDYDLRLSFKENDERDTLIIGKGVSISPVEMGDIEIKVIPSKTTGYPYPVTISVTNTGNVGMLYVPFNIATTFDFSVWRANHSFGDYAWSSMYTMNFDVLSNNNENDNIGYSPYTTSNSLFGTGLPGMMLHGFIPYLGPHETRDYIVGFVGSGHAMFNLYAWTGRPMNGVYEDEEGESNIYSVWKYLEKYDEMKQVSNTPKTRRAPNYEGMSNVLNTADHINGNAARAARTGVGIGLAGGGIINGLRLRQIHQYDDDDFAREVLSDYREELEQNMPDPSLIANMAGMPDWLAALLGLQQQQAGCGYPMPKAHPIEILTPGDPNDIYGYTSESGSKFMKKGTTDVYYTIEFENNPELANAAAHTIVVTDTLDSSRFVLSSFKPTSIKIGNKTMQLNGEKSFTKRTMDLRPAKDVVAQVSLDYDEQKGIAKWLIESLDPYTMEPINDSFRGALPVNVDGNGTGELAFDIQLKTGLTDGDEVNNRASIVFDQEDVIMTPTWTNIIDTTTPQSHVANVTKKDDATLCINVEASDALSGIWKYDLYCQKNLNADWERIGINVPVDSVMEIALEDAVNYRFYAVATDMAGNIEQKTARREFTFNNGGQELGDANGDGVVSIADVTAIINKINDAVTGTFNESAADVNGDGIISIADVTGVINIINQ